MNLLVTKQTRAIGETLQTFITLVRLTSPVRPHVCCKFPKVGKTLRANVAIKSFITIPCTVLYPARIAQRGPQVAFLLTFIGDVQRLFAYFT